MAQKAVPSGGFGDAMSCPHCDSKYSKPTKRKWADGKFDWMCSSCGRQVPEPEEQPAKQLTAEEILTAMSPQEELTEAAEIGRLYRRARTSFVDSVKLLLECGERLKTQKDTLDHGEWLPWLEKNEDDLGFGKRTAQMLMDAASRPFTTNTKLASNLSEEDALAVSRQIW